MGGISQLTLEEMLDIAERVKDWQVVCCDASNNLVVQLRGGYSGVEIDMETRTENSSERYKVRARYGGVPIGNCEGNVNENPHFMEVFSESVLKYLAKLYPLRKRNIAKKR